MATKMRKALAVTLVLLQLVALFAFNTSAAVTPAAQTVYRVDPNEMKLDGGDKTNEPWEKVGAIPLYNLSTAADKDMEDGASVKLMWGKDDNGVYLYALLQYNDKDTYYNNSANSTYASWAADGCQFAIDETGKSTATTVDAGNTGELYRTGNVFGRVLETVQTQNTCDYFVTRKTVGTYDVVVIEAKLTLNTKTLASSSVIGFNVLAQNYISDNSAMQCSCNGTNVNANASTFVKCTLNGTYAKNFMVPEAQTIYYVAPSSMTLDGTVTSKEPWRKLPEIPLYDLSTQSKEEDASVKLMWGKDNDGVYIYALLRYSDSNTQEDVEYWSADGCQFAVDETGTSQMAVVSSGKTGTLYRTGLAVAKSSEAVQTQNSCDYFVIRTENGDHDEIVIEAKLTLNTSSIDASDVVGFNALAQCYVTQSKALQYSMNGLNVDRNAPTFVKCTLSEELAKDIGAFIPPEATPTKAPALYGAQLRNKTNGEYDVRFVSKIDKLDYDEVGYIFDLEKFTGSEESPENIVEAETEYVSSNFVYKAINYTDESGKQQQLHATNKDYFVAIAITGIELTSDTDYVCGTVTPYGVDKDGNTYYGATYNVKIIDGKTCSFELYASQK